MVDSINYSVWNLFFYGWFVPACIMTPWTLLASYYAWGQRAYVRIPTWLHASVLLFFLNPDHNRLTARPTWKFFGIVYVAGFFPGTGALLLISQLWFYLNLRFRKDYLQHRSPPLGKIRF